jgi:cholest-4-en-3-one 26-monooxygenase
LSADWKTIDNTLLDPQWYATEAYHETFKVMRDEDPVHWTEDDAFGKHFWSITRYEDVKAYLNDHQRLSSRENSRVPRTPRRMTPEERHRLAFDLNVSNLDNPMHDVYRRPMNKHFSVPAIKRLDHAVRILVDDILAEVASRGECDLVENIAGELPVRLIMRMIGVPEEDWPLLRHAAWQFLAAADPKFIIDGDQQKTSETGLATIADYCADLAVKRRANPTDDFSSIVANIEVDGDKLSIHEMRVWFVTLIGAGLETTRNAAAVGLWKLLQEPGQSRLLLERPDLTSSAVEEILRWSTPAKNRLRIANEDFEFGGRKIRAGDWVVAFLASANKDERKFPDPHRFDITRTPNDHLSLGAGIHLCIGRALARLELEVLIPQVLRTFPDLSLAESGDPAWIADTSVTGFTTLPVTYTPVDYSTRALVA